MVAFHVVLKTEIVKTSKWLGGMKFSNELALDRHRTYTNSFSYCVDYNLLSSVIKQTFPWISEFREFVPVSGQINVSHRFDENISYALWILLTFSLKNPYKSVKFVQICKICTRETKLVLAICETARTSAVGQRILVCYWKFLGSNSDISEGEFRYVSIAKHVSIWSCSHRKSLPPTKMRSTRRPTVILRWLTN